MTITETSDNQLSKSNIRNGQLGCRPSPQAPYRGSASCPKELYPKSGLAAGRLIHCFDRISADGLDRLVTVRAKVSRIDGVAGAWGSCAIAARQPHRKHRAFARLARHCHVASHHARELAGEGKTEPRPAVAARCQRIGLREILEQFRLLLRGHTDALIRDGKLDPVAAADHPSRSQHRALAPKPVPELRDCRRTPMAFFLSLNRPFRDGHHTGRSHSPGIPLHKIA